MTAKYHEWDGSEYLDDPVSQAESFAAALEDLHPAHLRGTFGDVARAIGMTELARLAGIPRPDLYAALRSAEEGDPAPLVRIAEAARAQLEGALQAA